MNKKLTKGLYIGGVATVVAGASLSVILPVVLTQSSDVQKWTGADELDTLISGGLKDMSADDLIVEVEEIFEESRAFSRFDQQFQLYQYDKAQIDSIEEQKMLFEWEVIDNVKSLREIAGSGDDDDATLERIEDIIEEIEEITERIETLDKHYDADKDVWVTEASDGIDYSSTSLSYDYPNIKLTQAVISESQTDKFNDEKSNFIKGYPTSQEGLSAWPAHRSSSYGGALTDKEAIDYLVNRNISVAMSDIFQFGVSSSYNVEQKYANKVDFTKLTDAIKTDDNDELVYDKLKDFLDETITIGTNPADALFPFLENATVKVEDGYVLSENVTDSVYFIGTGASSIWDRSLNTNDFENDEYAKYLFENMELMSVSHALINAKPNVEGNHLPWTVLKEDIEKLYSFIGGATGSAIRPYELLPELFEDGKKDEYNSATDLFIRSASGNSEGTITKEGSLGTQSAISYVTSMVDGFGLGMIPTFREVDNNSFNHTFDDYSSSDLTDRSDASYNETNVMQILSDQLAKAEDTFFGGSLSSNKELSQKMANKTDEEVTAVFGDIFREVFDPYGDGTNLLYKGTDNPEADSFVGVVVSDEHGVHVVDVSLVDSQVDLKNLILEDLQTIADEQDTSKAQVDVNQLFTSFYDSVRQYQFVLENLMGDEGDGEFLDYYLENANEGDKVTSQKDIDSIKNDIANSINSEHFVSASEASESKSEWYIGAINSDLRSFDQLDPEEMYKYAYEMSGGKK